MNILSLGVLQCPPGGSVTIMWVGYENADTLITYIRIPINYPREHNLSADAQPIRMRERQPGNGHLVAEDYLAASIAAFAVLRSTPVRSL